MSTNKNISSKQKQSRIQNKLKYAVLICDSFSPNINTAVETYNCLSLVDEFPAIWYTISWLVENQVQQIFVLYSNDKDQIENYFATYQKSIDLKCHLNYVKPGELKSFGDAVREVQFRNLVNDDFLILYANTITNINLSKMVHSHFLKKDQLKSVVLTSGFQQGYAKNIHILNSNTGEILQIQSSIDQQLQINTDKINMKKVNIEFRRDIVPCEIFICTVEVLKSFKESYEYTTMNEFIIGMLTSEVYEQKINAYIIEKDEKSFRTSKSSDLYRLYMSYISGYLTPFTIYKQQELQPRQKELKKALSNFSVRQFNKVIKRGCKLSPSARLSNNIYIGQGTTIGDNCLINRSIILKNCKISPNVVLQNCIVLQGCDVKSNNGKYEFCKFENIGNTMKVTSFKNDIIDKLQEVLMERQLYEETPNDSEEEAKNFEEELENLLKEQPNSDSVIDLFTLRKSYNKDLNEFTKEMVRLLQPSGVKGVQQFVQKWGQIVFKLHEDQDLLLSSLVFTCQNVEKYNKGIHIFLQFFYIQEILSKQSIKGWFDSNQANVKPEMMALCRPFLSKLDEQSEEEDEEDEEEDDE